MFSKQLSSKSDIAEKIHNKQKFRNADIKNSIFKPALNNGKKSLPQTFRRGAELKQSYSNDINFLAPRGPNMPLKGTASLPAVTKSCLKSIKLNTTETPPSNIYDNMSEDAWSTDEDILYDQNFDKEIYTNLQTSVERNKSFLPLEPTADVKDFLSKYRESLHIPKLSLMPTKEIGQLTDNLINKIDLENAIQPAIKKRVHFLEPEETSNDEEDSQQEYLEESQHHEFLKQLQHSVFKPQPIEHAIDYKNNLNERGRIQNSFTGRKLNLSYPKILNMPNANKVPNVNKLFEPTEINEVEDELNETSEQDLVQNMMAQLKAKLKINSLSDVSKKQKATYSEDEESTLNESIEFIDTDDEHNHQMEINDLVTKIKKYSNAAAVLEKTPIKIEEIVEEKPTTKEADNTTVEGKIDELITNLSKYAAVSRKKVEEINTFINDTKQHLEETMDEHMKNRKNLLKKLKERFSTKLLHIDETCKKLEQIENNDKSLN